MNGEMINSFLRDKWMEFNPSLLYERLVQRVRSVQDGHDDLPRAYVVYNANLHC